MRMKTAIVALAIRVVRHRGRHAGRRGRFLPCQPPDQSQHKTKLSVSHTIQSMSFDAEVQGARAPCADALIEEEPIERKQGGTAMLKGKWVLQMLLMLAMCAQLSPMLVAQEATKPLSNADVVNMVKAGVPQSVIISSIQSRPVKFDLSPAGLAVLVRNGVSQNIQDAMKASMSVRQGSPSSGAPGTEAGAN